MVKTFILYYLAIKPTHGYEIHKFIQVNHLDQWSKIQSGSIYYALGKLEKQGCIQLKKAIELKGKIREIYEITDRGRIELGLAVQEEVAGTLYETGSDKFIIYTFLNHLTKEAIEKELVTHIEVLQQKRVEIRKWQQVKGDSYSTELEKVSFEMRLSSLDYQIKWHQVLHRDLDEYMAISKQIEELIRHTDFSVFKEVEHTGVEPQQEQIHRLKQEILKQPDQAEKKLEELIKLMGR